MKFLTMIAVMLAVLVGLMVPASVFAQADTEPELFSLFADCDFFEYKGMATTGADSFWCVDLSGTAYNVAAGAGLADYFPPKYVTVGINAVGRKTKEKRPVKRLVLFGLDAFGAQGWLDGASAPSGGADGSAYIWPEATAGGEHFLVFDYPDSVQTAGVAAADSLGRILIRSRGSQYQCWVGLISRNR